MSKILGKIAGGKGASKFISTIIEDADGRVHFIADASIDADGANGQNGGPVAYRVDDSGTDYLDNAGMKIRRGKVVCKNDDARSIIILDTDNEPKVFPGGLIASMTWYKHPELSSHDPAAYVDSETIPYIVIPPLVMHKTVGIVRGCLARVTFNNKSIDCVVADLSGGSIGELSIAAARALGIPASPRDGGLETCNVLYELWPGTAAPGFVLQPA